MKSHYLIFATAVLSLAAASTFPKAGSKCETDEDCYTEYEYCTHAHLCKHRNIFPARGSEIGGIFLFTFLVFFSSFAGLSGGFAYLSLMLLFKFTVSTAIYLSNSQIAISSILRIVSGLGKPHPLKGPHGTLFHFQVLSLLIPMISLGAAMATLVSRVMPDLYIVVLYVVIMTGVLIFNLDRLKVIIKKEWNV